MPGSPRWLITEICVRAEWLWATPLDHKWPLLRQETQSGSFSAGRCLCHLLTDRVLDKSLYRWETSHFTCKGVPTEWSSFSTGWQAVSSRRWWLKSGPLPVALDTWEWRAPQQTVLPQPHVLWWRCVQYRARGEGGASSRGHVGKALRWWVKALKWASGLGLKGKD